MSTASTSEVSIVQSHHASSIQVKPTKVLLATAKVIILSNSGQSVKVRAFLNQGSTWSFISKELVSALQIRLKQLKKLSFLV